ncbi:hypothetical protein PENTCL1PPCAC_7142, partial [Pristionchus entomophagus]
VYRLNPSTESRHFLILHLFNHLHGSHSRHFRLASWLGGNSSEEHYELLSGQSLQSLLCLLHVRRNLNVDNVQSIGLVRSSGQSSDLEIRRITSFDESEHGL